MINVLFFASLREQLNCEQLTLATTPEISNITELRTALIQQHPTWQIALNNPMLLVAVNQSIANDNSEIKSGDEVAFFPPVTGG